MLKPLSKKLNIIFITVIMLIITSIMIILCNNYVHMDGGEGILVFFLILVGMLSSCFIVSCILPLLC